MPNGSIIEGGPHQAQGHALRGQCQSQNGMLNKTKQDNTRVCIHIYICLHLWAQVHNNDQPISRSIPINLMMRKHWQVLSSKPINQHTYKLRVVSPTWKESPIVHKCYHQKGFHHIQNSVRCYAKTAMSILTWGTARLIKLEPNHRRLGDASERNP